MLEILEMLYPTNRLHQLDIYRVKIVSAHKTRKPRDKTQLLMNKHQQIENRFSIIIKGSIRSNKN